jgi:16S rRNA G966 N2-methylase RsmD
MNRSDAEEYTQALGLVVAGSWRHIALAHRLGVPKALGMKLDQWVRERLGGYAKMSISERREAVMELAAEGASSREIGSILGVGKSTIAEDVQFRTASTAETKETDDATVQDRTPLDAIPGALKTRSANERLRKAVLDQPSANKLATGLHHGDFRDLTAGIEAESVQLIFTDPPYDAASVDLYGDAARHAARILRPGGSFIAYSGQRHLPAVLAACAPYLDYWWTIACVHDGANQILNKLGVRCGWKPLIWFVKATRGDVQNVLSDVVSGGREKDDHNWQQAEVEADYYIERLCPPGGLVVDFFAGSGTTGAAAQKLGRHWIGFEIDRATFERATLRIIKGAFDDGMRRLA